MSDVKLFRLTDGKAEELTGKPARLEKDLQNLIEANLESFLRVRMVASEYLTGKTHAGRIDTLGLDENGCPTIIEYKRNSNANVINQGLFYLDWLMDHQAEFEFLIFAAQTDNKQTLDEEICRKLLSLPARMEEEVTTENAKNAEKECSSSPVFALSALSVVNSPDLKRLRDAEVQVKLGEIENRNGQFFDEEVLKLDRWSEDLKLSLEREIKDIDKQIRELRRTAALAQSLQDKLACQKQIRDLERRRNAKRRELFDAQDAIDRQREELIVKIEKQLTHTTELTPLFTVRWRVV